MQASSTLSRPRLRTIESTGEERHASWLELFFDLVFVLAVSQIAHLLDEDLSPWGFLRFIALFAPVWWSWVGYSFYADRFENDEITYRLLMFTAMLAVAALGVNIGKAFKGGAVAFAISYFVLRAVLILAYVRAGYYVPLARDLCVRYVVGFSVAAAFWLWSAFVPAPLNYVLWGVGLVVELLTPLVNVGVVRRTPYDASHIPERFGLFTLIVLGEAVLLTVNGVANTNWRFVSVLVAVAGFAVAVALWWIYFEFVEACGLRLAWLAAGQTYIYGHFPVVLAIAAVGVGAQHAITEVGRGGALSVGTRAALGGGVALFLTAIALIRIATRRTNLVGVRIATASLITLLVIGGGSIAPLLFVAVLLATLITEVCLEVRWDDTAQLAHGEADDLLLTRRCPHLSEVREVAPHTEGCEECLAGEQKWVHLRLCQTCGHVGCCDSSKNKHATKHFQETGHPIITSLEQGENWTWCYVDERFVAQDRRKIGADASLVEA